MNGLRVYLVRTFIRQDNVCKNKCPHFHAGSEVAYTPQWHPGSPTFLHHRQSPILHCCTPPPFPLSSVSLQPNECHHYCMVGLEVLNNKGYCVDTYILDLHSYGKDYICSRRGSTGRPIAYFEVGK